MLEPIIAAVVMVACWFLCILTYDDDMGFGRYGFLAFLGLVSLWCLIRFIHWAWMTPFPFVGSA